MWHVDAVLHTVHTCFFLYKVSYCVCYTHTLYSTWYFTCRRTRKWLWRPISPCGFYALFHEISLHGHIAMSWVRSFLFSYIRTFKIWRSTHLCTSAACKWPWSACRVFVWRNYRIMHPSRIPCFSLEGGEGWRVKGRVILPNSRHVFSTPI
jgi:hypothetical protein